MSSQQALQRDPLASQHESRILHTLHCQPQADIHVLGEVFVAGDGEECYRFTRCSCGHLMDASFTTITVCALADIDADYREAMDQAERVRAARRSNAACLAKLEESTLARLGGRTV